MRVCGVKVDTTDDGIPWPALNHLNSSSLLLIYFQIKDFVFRTIFALPLLCAKYTKWNRDRSGTWRPSEIREGVSDFKVTTLWSPENLFSSERREHFRGRCPLVRPPHDPGWSLITDPPAPWGASSWPVMAPPTSGDSGPSRGRRRRRRWTGTRWSWTGCWGSPWPATPAWPPPPPPVSRATSSDLRGARPSSAVSSLVVSS